MTNEQIFTVLAEHQLFEGISREDLQCLARSARLRSYHKNSLVFDQSDQKMRHFFLILEGRFELHLQNYNNKIMHPGEVFGEVAFFSNEHRTGSVVALDKSRLLAFPRSVFFEQEALSAEAKVNILRRLTNQIISYLSHNLQRSSAVLASRGENIKVEFKASYNRSSGAKAVILRTVAAMLNSEGGSILLGIKNDGEVLGLNGLDTESLDQAVTSLINHILDKLGKEHCDLIDVYGDEIDGKTILRIDCTPSKVPVFTPVALPPPATNGKAKSKKQKGKKKQPKAPIRYEYVFFRRTGPSNTTLKNRDLVPYLKKRFFLPEEAPAANG